MPDFRLISAPTAGSLAGKEASFVVFGYADGGVSLLEGRAFVQHEGRVFTLSFTDEAARFDSQVPRSNAIMEALVLHETARSQAPTFGFGVDIGSQGGSDTGAAGAQYEIMLAVIDNVPVTVQEALEELKNNMMGQYAYIYTVSTRRARIGGQAGVAADIVVPPNYTEPWSQVDLWYRTVTFYALKSGNTLLVRVIPKEIEEHPAVVAAMESFEWLGR